MTIHRFFINDALISDQETSFGGEVAFQITKVLRLQPGDEVIILDDDQNEYLIKLKQLNTQAVSGTIESQTKNQNEPNIEIYLYPALLPREKFELVLQKGTELGVSHFIPITTERTLPKLDSKEAKIERWQKILKESAEQSERGKIPTISHPMKLTQALSEAITRGTTLIAWEDEKEKTLNDMRLTINDKRLSIFIGPEGGFSEKEIDEARSRGAQTISLGPRVLRSETAGPVMAALVLFLPIPSS